ncbi:hypothetical protein F511_38370 [Dorcoceras hygrometricum]|uniref:Retrotransposon Copia-like N-terminal domain-containing protein n=1 Tax=Dorcoceras hygrometricum TaxID=472368 RepID=A0A2Z7AY38_9LAMI|nr:hypothetical protein F511_38370 [Dorcoceras hygrometricum]
MPIYSIKIKALLNVQGGEFSVILLFHFFFMVSEPLVRTENSASLAMAATISLNVANFVTLKLTPENYPLWREQLLALAESQDMVGLLTGEK